MRTREILLSALVLPVLALGPVPGTAVGQEAATQTPAESTASGRRVVTGDLTIEAGHSVGGTVVVGGTLRVRGEVDGDAVVVGGDLILEATGTVLGDAVVTGGRLVNEGGRVRGEMRTVDGSGMDVAREIEQAIAGTAAGAASESRRESRSERATARTEGRDNRQGFWLDPVRRGASGIVSTLALWLVLAGIGATLVFYGRPYLETVSDTVRGATLRSGATGLAASFLVIPAFVVLIVALSVSIIGIPLLLVAIPLYPLALFAATVLGLLGVTHAIGERTAEQSRTGLDLRYSNSYAYLFTGLGMVLMPLLAAHLIAMTGFLGFIGTLLKIATWCAIWFASTVGLGAVILSRAGTRRTFVRPMPEASFDADDFFGDTPGGRHEHA